MRQFMPGDMAIVKRKTAHQKLTPTSFQSVLCMLPRDIFCEKILSFVDEKSVTALLKIQRECNESSPQQTLFSNFLQPDRPYDIIFPWPVPSVRSLLALQLMCNYFHLDSYYCEKHGRKLQKLKTSKKKASKKRKAAGNADPHQHEKLQCEDCLEDARGNERCSTCKQFAPKNQLFYCHSCHKGDCNDCLEEKEFSGTCDDCYLYECSHCSEVIKRRLSSGLQCEVFLMKYPTCGEGNVELRFLDCRGRLLYRCEVCEIYFCFRCRPCSEDYCCCICTESGYCRPEKATRTERSKST